MDDSIPILVGFGITCVGAIAAGAGAGIRDRLRARRKKKAAPVLGIEELEELARVDEEFPAAPALPTIRTEAARATLARHEAAKAATATSAACRTIREWTMGGESPVCAWNEHERQHEIVFPDGATLTLAEARVLAAEGLLRLDGTVRQASERRR